MTIAYTQTDLQDPRGERGTSAEVARLSAGGQQSSVGPSFFPSVPSKGYRKLVFLKVRSIPRGRIEPYFDFPLPTAAYSS